jgi:hypothetical protein
VMNDTAPTGYISLFSALKNLAGIDEYTEANLECLDIGDRLNDAQAMHDTTQVLRQHLCDSVLTGYYLVGDGKPHPVQVVTWTLDEACLEHAGVDFGFKHLLHFHHRGIEVNDVRFPVFLIEREFEKLRKGEAKPAKSMVPKIKLKPGPRKGDNEKQDSVWLDMMEKKVLQGKSVYNAASDTFHENKEALKAGSAAKDESIIKRLYDKYRKTTRAGSPLSTD